MMTVKFKSSEISKNYTYLKKLFGNEKAKTLSEQDQKNYVIDLMKNTESLKELTKLRRYLNDVLNKK